MLGRVSAGFGVLKSFRNKLHRIAGPLPLPTAHEIVPLGGRAGEWEGQAKTKRL